MKRLGTVVFAFVAALVIALPAAAQQYPPEGEAPLIIQPEAPSDALAVTGADVALWVGIGLAMVALGVVLLRLRRRAAQT